MSFFGFDASGRHNTGAPGFSQAHDPFAGLSNRDDEADALDFDDTYDGLGDQLDESGDAFNDDTFGGGGNNAMAPTSVGKDFDFFGQTAKVSDAIEEEQVRFSRQQPAPRAAPAAVHTHQPAHAAVNYYATQQQQQQQQPYQQQSYARPARSGYEKYHDAEPIPDLHVDASLWGMPAKKATTDYHPAQPQPSTGSAPSRKMMSLEEVEAAMREQSKHSGQAPPPEGRSQNQHQPEYYGQQVALHHQHQQHQSQYYTDHADQHGHPAPGPQPGQGQSVTILQRPQSHPPKHQQPVPGGASPQASQQQQPQPPAVQPTQILQNPQRLSGDTARVAVPSQPTHRSQGSIGRGPQLTPQQQLAQQQYLAQLSEEDKAAYLDQETKRAKRNHKIWLLSKDNGLMTPQDKNFITRIQLQQLVSATGNPIDNGGEGSLSEDFYYQVLTQIRGGQRQNPNQPLNNFAQTYLFQTGGRPGGMRRHGRAAENHVQRMEQQVQRAVEAAKNKPKNPQLVIAGSLGKISFSNAKTPKPLLNIKRTESAADAQKQGSGKRADNESSALDRKAILKNIERVYETVMMMEDHARQMPPPPSNGNDDDFHAKHREWVDAAQQLNAKLWSELKVHEPIRDNSIHPFIAFLSFPKGKKVIPRVFRHTDFEQRTTILTMVVFHLDALDVVRGAQLTHGEKNLSAQLRENIELFSNAVMPSLFAYFNDTQIDIVTGVLGIITKLNVDLIAKTRIGTSMLTLVLSRAELLKQGGGGTPQLWKEWYVLICTFRLILPLTLLS